MVKFAVSFIILAVYLTGCGDLESELSSLSISPSSLTIGINKSQLFSVNARDTLGFIVYVTPTWSVTGGLGSISSSGIFTAGSNTGEVAVVATYGSTSSSAEVVVTDQAWIQGTVLDSVGYKVSSLKVYLGGYQSTFFDLTDSDGFYSISNIPTGTYEVWTSINTVYRATSREVSVGRGETETVNFTIEYFTPPPDLNPPEFEL